MLPKSQNFLLMDRNTENQSKPNRLVKPTLIYLFGKMARERIQWNLEAGRRDPLWALLPARLRWPLRIIGADPRRGRRQSPLCTAAPCCWCPSLWGWISESLIKPRLQKNYCPKKKRRNVRESSSGLPSPEAGPVLPQGHRLRARGPAAHPSSLRQAPRAFCPCPLFPQGACSRLTVKTCRRAAHTSLRTPRCPLQIFALPSEDVVMSQPPHQDLRLIIVRGKTCLLLS